MKARKPRPLFGPSIPIIGRRPSFWLLTQWNLKSVARHQNHPAAPQGPWLPHLRLPPKLGSGSSQRGSPRPSIYPGSGSQRGSPHPSVYPNPGNHCPSNKTKKRPSITSKVIETNPPLLAAVMIPGGRNCPNFAVSIPGGGFQLPKFVVSTRVTRGGSLQQGTLVPFPLDHVCLSEKVTCPLRQAA